MKVFVKPFQPKRYTCPYCSGRSAKNKIVKCNQCHGTGVKESDANYIIMIEEENDTNVPSTTE